MLLAVGLALLIGISGGLAGGLLATRLADGPVELPSPAVATVTAKPEQPFESRVRAAIARAAPSVVTVVARLPDAVDPDGRVRERGAFGSGVVISDAGHVITNFHVIDGAESVTVVLSTGEERPAVIVSDDSPFSDLAVLQVPPQGLRSATFGDSAALRQGDTVIAVAAAGFTVDNSVSVGVVSGTGRSWPRNGVILDDLVQTDAAVNNGDSGGALLNLEGEVVGLITTVVREAPNGAPLQGIAFAQSSNSLRGTVEAIIGVGFRVRPRLGIERLSQHVEIVPALAESQGLPVPFGALVLRVAPGSAADAAGILPGDIVVGLNGVAVDLESPFVNLLMRLSRRTRAELLIVRDGRQIVIPISPTEE